jgi:DNA-binding CsgD family transcriptional regulator
MTRKVIIYGIALALLATLLSVLQYHWLIRSFPFEIYLFVLALLFTAMGVWAGKKLTGTSATVRQDFKANHEAISYLGLSDRELEILLLIAEGLSNRDIADRLYISTNTVKTHISNLFSKLDVNRRTQAIKKARSLKIIR